jgi:hypothetical protein
MQNCQCKILIFRQNKALLMYTVVLLGNPGPGPEIGKIPEFFEVPVPIPVPTFMSRFQTGNFHFYVLDLTSFYFKKLPKKEFEGRKNGNIFSSPGLRDKNEH